jgi:predicted TIM-barrel fold metal-dependent hydrolase
MLADSHIHIFENGYRNSGESEISSYEELMKDHAIKCALVVGYEGEGWASGNNAYISSLAQTRRWIHPLGFIQVRNLRVSHLESLLKLGFEGISLYVFSESDTADLLAVDESVWAWLVDHKWMISVNSKGKFWDSWLEVMGSQPELTLLISHLGLPSVDAKHLTRMDIALELSTVEKLHKYRNVYLKLSGFYALEQGSPTYPYPSLRNYLLYIIENFDLRRLIWGSDFTPALATVTFPQTFEHISELDSSEVIYSKNILYENLIRLLSNVEK